MKTSDLNTNTHLKPMFANLDVNSAAMRSLLYSSVQVAFFLEKKSISRVTVDMQLFSMLNMWVDTATSWSILHSTDIYLLFP